MEEDGAFYFAPLPHLPAVVCVCVCVLFAFWGERGAFLSYSVIQTYV